MHHKLEVVPILLKQILHSVWICTDNFQNIYYFELGLGWAHSYHAVSPSVQTAVAMSYYNPPTSCKFCPKVLEHKQACTENKVCSINILTYITNKDILSADAARSWLTLFVFGRLINIPEDYRAITGCWSQHILIPGIPHNVHSHVIQTGFLSRSQIVLVHKLILLDRVYLEHYNALQTKRKQSSNKNGWEPRLRDHWYCCHRMWVKI